MSAYVQSPDQIGVMMFLASLQLQKGKESVTLHSPLFDLMQGVATLPGNSTDEDVALYIGEVLLKNQRRESERAVFLSTIEKMGASQRIQKTLKELKVTLDAADGIQPLTQSPAVSIT